MGLAEGWATDLSLPRTAQLRALGNGVVLQQAAYAIALLLDDLAELLDITTDTSHRPQTGQEVDRGMTTPSQTATDTGPD